MPDVSSKYSLWEFEVYPALPPTPAIAQVGTKAVISWPASVTGWLLQETPVLGPHQPLDHRNEHAVSHKLAKCCHHTHWHGRAILPPPTEPLRLAFARNEIVFYIRRPFGQILADAG